MLGHTTPGGPMQLSRRSALLAATGTLFPRPVAAGSASTAPREALDGHFPEFENFILETLKKTGIPGLSVAIVHKDQVVYLKGFGIRQAGKPERVDADTMFQLASLSKPVASTVVAALVGDGTADWGDPIIRHDPSFALQDAWVTREVTLRDMFCHRSGLPDHAGDRLEDIGYDRSEVLHRLRYIKPDSSFRSHYAYTNFGFTAAAVAAAKAAGKSWEELSVERLYRPLGMKNTSSRFVDFIAAPNRAAGHVRDKETWVAKFTRDADAQSPAGGVSSSARDMAQWLRLQMGRGSLAGRDIVKAAALDETHRPQMVSGPATDVMKDHSAFYGLGWGIAYDERGHIRWSHSGAFSLGAATCVNILPSEEIGIVCLTNTSPIGMPEAVCRSFLDLALTGKIEKDWLALFGPMLAKVSTPDYGTAMDYSRPPHSPFPALAASAYLGAYRNDLYGRVEVIETAAGVVLNLGPKPASFALHHFDRDVFTYQPTGENAYGPAAVTFAIGADQKAMSVTIENLDIEGQGTFGRVMG
jgi:CubicO group peptidase (beta-lactamase class C family)